MGYRRAPGKRPLADNLPTALRDLVLRLRKPVFIIPLVTSHTATSHLFPSLQATSLSQQKKTAPYHSLHLHAFQPEPSTLRHPDRNRHTTEHLPLPRTCTMSNTAPTAAAPKAEHKEKEAPATHPKAEKAESESKPKPKEKAASDSDSSDDSDDSDDEKDPEKKEKKKAKKAEKAKNASTKDHAGGKPKKDAGLFARIQAVGRQEQRQLTLSSRKAPSQETRPKQRYVSRQHTSASPDHPPPSLPSNRILTRATTASIHTNHIVSLTPKNPHSCIKDCTCRNRNPSRRRHVFHHRPCCSDACSPEDLHRSLGAGCDYRASSFCTTISAG